MNTRTYSYRHPLSKLLPHKPVGPMRVPARLLGWFSIGLGLAELLAPRGVSRAAGTQERPALVRSFGLREIGTGIGLLTMRNPAPWMWGRVVGDVLDAAVVAGSARGGGRPLRALATLAVLGLVLTVDTKVAVAATKGPRKAVRDYSDRSGFPRPAAEMRGLARRVTGEPPVSSTTTATAAQPSGEPVAIRAV